WDAEAQRPLHAGPDRAGAGGWRPRREPGAAADHGRRLFGPLSPDVRSAAPWLRQDAEREAAERWQAGASLDTAGTSWCGPQAPFDREVTERRSFVRKR